MHRSACAALLIVTAITPEVAVTQQLAAGDSISVRPTRPEVRQPAWGVEESGRPWTEARVVRITRDTLWYRTGVRVEQLAVGDAEVRRPTGRDHRVPGMVLGGISGAVIGGVAGYLSFQPEFKRQGNIGTAFVCAITIAGPSPNPIHAPVKPRWAH